MNLKEALKQGKLSQFLAEHKGEAGELSPTDAETAVDELLTGQKREPPSGT